jgi:hypothetical protein
MTYLVDRTPAVNQQVRDLAKHAKARRISEAYQDALKRIARNLQERPLEWGDPQSHTQHPGGLYCHGVEWPLYVRYTAYEAERKVIIYDISPLPHTPLSDF